ncbi:MAG: hypothetical protein IID34_04495 [Planctomycetes bacterium]|nr:hypothetical protein [Planctomycetota bacterium]
MELRRLLLRIMLWSLGFAALTGVGAILLQGGDLTWRVVATGLVTAAAAGLLMACSKMVDREKTRSAGLLGMCGVIAEFVMALLMIWEAIQALFGVNMERRVGLTMLHVGLCLPVAVVLLQQIQRERTRWLARVGAVFCAIVLALLLVGVWNPTRWPRFDYDWWKSAGAVSIYGLLVVLCLVDAGTPRWRRWRWMGVAAAGVAATMWLYDIWIGSGSDPGFVIFVTLTCAAAVIAHASLASLCPLTAGQRWMLWGTVAAATLTAGLADLLIVGDRLLHFTRNETSFLWRGTGASGILAGCGTLALVVLAALNREIDYEPGSKEMLSLFLTCPRCGKKQNVAIGEANCVACDLRISTRIEEPRCRKCGYLLYKLTSDRCPECGEVVNSKQ